MKASMIAAAALVAMVTMASAQPTFLAYSEYAVEAETLELGAGAEFVVTDSVLVTPVVVGFGTQDTFDFDHAEFKVEYLVNENWTVFGRVETDADFDYADTFIGAELQF